MPTITFAEVPSEQSRAAKRDIMQADMLSFALLFSGDRWSHVTHVAIARDEAGTLIGFASLAMHGEDGESTPEIVGVWVHPEHRRKNIGTHLLIRCVNEAQALGVREPVRIFGITNAGHALARRACERGLRLDVRSSIGFGNLP